MKKRIIGLVMVLVLALALMGCGGSKTTEKKNDSGSKTEELKLVENATVYDSEVFSFKVSKMEWNDKGGFVVHITFENKTTDKELMVAVVDIALNKYYNISLMDKNSIPYVITPGMSYDTQINIEPKDIAKYGIKDISQLDFALLESSHIGNNSDIICSLLTYGKEMDIAKPGEPGGKCYVDNDYCSIYINRVDGEDGVTLSFDIRNKTNSTIWVDGSDKGADGYASTLLDSSTNKALWINRMPLPGTIDKSEMKIIDPTGNAIEDMYMSAIIYCFDGSSEPILENFVITP